MFQHVDCSCIGGHASLVCVTKNIKYLEDTYRYPILYEPTSYICIIHCMSGRILGLRPEDLWCIWVIVVLIATIHAQMLMCGLMEKDICMIFAFLLTVYWIGLLPHHKTSWMKGCQIMNSYYVHSCKHMSLSMHFSWNYSYTQNNINKIMSSLIHKSACSLSAVLPLK